MLAYGGGGLRPPVLFRAEGFDRIGEGGTDGLKGDGEQGYGCGEDACREEDVPLDGDAVGEVPEPFVHGKIGDRKGDEGGDGYEYEEVGGQEGNDAAGAGAEDLADADLLYPLGYGEGAETEQTET